MGLRRPNQFTRRGRRLPGQSSDEDLGLERDLNITIKVYGDAAVIEQELVQIGDLGAGDYVEIGPNGIQIFSNGTAVQVSVDETITLGDQASGNYITIDADGIDIYDAGAKVQAIAGETITLGDTTAGNYIEISATGIDLYDNSTKVQTIADETIIIGEVASGNYITIDADGINIYNNGTLTHTYDDTTAVINQDTVQVGDVSAGNYIEISASAISIYNEGAKIEVWSDADGSAAQAEFRVTGDASNNEAWIGLVATDYGSTTQVSMALDTQNDRASISAAQLLIGSNLRFLPITTTQRNALTAVDGMLIYNSTDSKFQGRAGGSWVDLH